MFITNNNDINNVSKTFSFTHNDLHTNNIMYKETDEDIYIINIIINL